MDSLPQHFDLAAEQPISTDIGMADNMFFKQHVIPRAGTYVPQHSHTYDHISFLAVGSLRAWADGVPLGDFVAPKLLTIKAHKKHAFLSLVDGTVFHCIHNVERAGHVEEEEHHELVAPPPIMGEPDDAGFTFQQEPFDVWLKDGTPLFDEHLVQVGEAPGSWTDKNLPLMRRLAALGVLHVTTARCNGRMFGYLMAIVSPTLYSADRTEALHTTFFCAPSAPGLGLKLQHASINFLRSIGVNEVVFRAGTQGDGPRLGALYRRLGAVDAGQLFLLDLKEA